MSSAMLKILACLFMLIDHAGYILFPQQIIFRVIGRLAFPIFAYLIAEGYRRTSDVANYLGRLFLFALISQIPFEYAFGIKSGHHLNVFFTLAMGLFAIYAYERKKDSISSARRMFFVIIIAFACEVMGTDYGAFGVLLVFFFSLYHDNFKRMAWSAILLTVTFQGIHAVMFMGKYTGYVLERQLEFALFIQPLSLFSLMLIRLYNGRKGWNLKYIFYVFYPVHLILLREIYNFAIQYHWLPFK